MSKYKLLALLLGAFALAGCPSQPLPDPEPQQDTVGDGADTDPYGTNNMDSGSDIPDDSIGGGELDMVIYFDFDSSEVRADDNDLVARHAMQLAESRFVNVRLEGHADERGSREYNIGLGERRAQSIRRMLMLQGVAASQISTVSFGEERPAEQGSSEYAYSQNRRVVFNYTN